MTTTACQRRPTIQRFVQAALHAWHRRPLTQEMIERYVDGHDRRFAEPSPADPAQPTYDTFVEHLVSAIEVHATSLPGMNEAAFAERESIVEFLRAEAEPLSDVTRRCTRALAQRIEDGAHRPKRPA